MIPRDKTKVTMLDPSIERKLREVARVELAAHPQIEQGLIASIYGCPNAKEVLDSLPLDEPDFQDVDCRRVYGAMRHASTLTFAHILDGLTKRGQGDIPLAEVLTPPATENLGTIEELSAIIKQHSQRRRMASDFEDLRTRTANGESLDAIITQTEAVAAAAAAVSAVGRVDIDAFPTIQQLALNRPKPKFVIDGAIREGTVTAFTGSPGCGKSTVAAIMAAEVARGGVFAGRQCTRRKTLYIDRGENPLDTVVERFERMGVLEDTNCKYWGDWGIESGLPAVPNLDSSVLVAWVKKQDVKPLVVLDSWVAFLGGADENDSSVCRPAMKAVRRLADLGASIILIHHIGKSETAKLFRGSSDFEAGVDSAYLVSNTGGLRLDNIKLKCFKGRSTVEEEIRLRYRNAHLEADNFGSAESVEDQLAAILTNNSGATASEFETLVISRGIGRDKARKWLGDAVLAGRVHQTTGKKNQKKYYFKIGDES